CGVLVLGAMRQGQPNTIAFLLFGFTGLAVFDTIIYAQLTPLPHAMAGLVSAAFAVYFFLIAKRSVT
ncbi:MAG: hypothetical protein ACPG5U_10380, partial [Planktomarina sp.]